MATNHNEAKIREDVVKIFTRHLEDNAYRKTPERFAILDEIYSRNDHFDAEALYIQMKAKNYRVSRATVYNTLELLVTCNLVMKHQFGQNHALFEKCYGSRQHDHLICTECGTVAEFCDPRIGEINHTVGDILNWNIDHHRLIFYGVCPNCAAQVKTETPQEAVASKE